MRNVILLRLLLVYIKLLSYAVIRLDALDEEKESYLEFVDVVFSLVTA